MLQPSREASHETWYRGRTTFVPLPPLRLVAYVTSRLRIDRRNGWSAGLSNEDAIASRQRDWRMSAKSETAIGVAARIAPSRASPAVPSPDQADPSTTSRSVSSARPTSCSKSVRPNGTSPSHQRVTGRSWTSRGGMIDARWEPASPAADTTTVSEHIAGPPWRGSAHRAVMSARTARGPSGSTVTTTIDREG